MYEEFIAKRVAELREKAGVSAREMSLDIGQNGSYVNRIENGKSLPSVQGLLYICEYLKVTPAEFFSEDNRDPVMLKELYKDICLLTPEQMRIIHDIVLSIKKLDEIKPQ